MTEKTTTEQRAEAQTLVLEAQKAVDRLDQGRAEAVLAIFEKPAFKKIVEELRALVDDADSMARQRPASADVSALVVNLLIPFENGPQLAQAHIERLEALINPPPAPSPPATPPLA